ncbi:YceI family protein [Winogradskyella psychrotolerans]|uniref:YceI family protein n=1 Tax=Winogradskyella psychrotolerans TaxID=1344585 RepID=UPI001C07564E|nr:YceI family protein [Winogradskyella psychrotolerans]MBU2919904.1 YceI family protein [Winogradskyella psychrotolerans]
MLKTLSYIILFFFGSASFIPKMDVSKFKESTINLSSESYLKIKGKTNVSTFECQFDMTAISEAINITYKDEDSIVKFNDTKLILPNLEFNCGGKAINKDFNKLLNTEEFPEITLKLKKLSKSKTKANSITATIEINISNIVNTYTIPISVINNNDLHVSGVMPLDINDFSLTAPTKMLGMVKVSPKIEIQFSLKILE